MTEIIFFDTDCLSAFLWVNKENLITQLYRDRIAIPEQVFSELKKVPPLKDRVVGLKSSKLITICSLDFGTPEADFYLTLTAHPDEGYKVIGRGEASAIALARFRGGVLASNNLRDILPYTQLYNLKHITTGHILSEALNKKIITEGQGNAIWKDMLIRGRLLPAATFSDFLTNK
jgi:predicted nucleic acid-binding protein